MRKFKVSNNLSSFFLKNEKKRQEIKKKEKKQAVTKNDRSGKVERTELIKKDKRVKEKYGTIGFWLINLKIENFFFFSSIKMNISEIAIEAPQARGV